MDIAEMRDLRITQGVITPREDQAFIACTWDEELRVRPKSNLVPPSVSVVAGVCICTPRGCIKWHQAMLDIAWMPDIGEPRPYLSYLWWESEDEDEDEDELLPEDLDGGEVEVRV